jgi:hypothetical protein
MISRSELMETAISRSFRACAAACHDGDLLALEYIAIGGD